MTIPRNLSFLAEGASSTGVLGVANGGTGLSSTPANGTLNIGNGSGFTRTTLTAGSGISVTNASGSITIANTQNTGPAFSAYQSAAQAAIPASTATKVQFQTKEFDTNTNFDATTNYRFTPTLGGYYQINAGLQIVGSTAGLAIYIYKNGSLYKSGNFVGVLSANPAITVSSIVNLDGSTDYVEIYVYTTTSLALQPQPYATYFNGSMVRGT